MAITNNYVPEKINEYNVYLDGVKMIGVAEEVELPTLGMKSGNVEGMGILGEVESPTLGQFEKMEQVINFSHMYSSAAAVMQRYSSVNITVRAAQQNYDLQGGYNHIQLRVVSRGRVKNFEPGKLKRGENMGAKLTLELTYLLIETGGQKQIEIDKLNNVYKVNGVDLLAQIRAMV